MSTPTPPASYLAVAVSLVPKLTALAFLAVWITGGAGSAGAGKLGLAFGVLALFDALTLASLRKGSVAVDWSDVSLVIGSLLGPTVLPIYAVVVIGVITLGTEGPEVRRTLGGPPGMERLASSTPARFTGPNRNVSVPGQPQSSSAPGSASSSNGPNAHVPPNFQQRPGGAPPSSSAPNVSAGNGTPPAGLNPARPPFNSSMRPAGAPPTNQRPISKETLPPSPAPAPAATSAPSATPPPASTTGSPTQSAKP